jgi:hypothetical protein
MNHFRCKPLNRALGLGFDSAAAAFFTAAVEKPGPLQAETIVHLSTPVIAVESFLTRRSPLPSFDYSGDDLNLAGFCFSPGF